MRILTSHDRQIGRLWALLFPALALCVFLWGLEYKMSLYEPPHSVSHQIPEAKLLSKNERIGMSAAESAASATRLNGTASERLVTGPLLFFAIAILAAAAVDQGRLAPEHREIHLPRRLFHRRFFVRPPPTLV